MMDLEMRTRILDLIRSDNYKPLKIGEFSMALNISAIERENLEDSIKNLEKQGELIITKKGKIMALPSNMVKGIFQGTAKGYGFVVQGSEKNDIFIPAQYTNGAMNKDEVLCRITEESYADRKRSEGEIIRILKRGYKEIVGIYEKERNFGFVIPDDKKLYYDIYIPNGENKGAVSGQKVVVRVTKPSDEQGRSPEGKVVEILGHKNDPGVDILSIVKQLNIPTEFSESVLRQIEQIPEEVLPEDITGRTDLRNVKTVTIDGEDTKDIDDAISLKILENGNFQLGVHIADVTNYVREGSQLDKEAFLRGTSVYLADRVIPMLPHKLSNGICSLNEDVDRLALSCIMEITKKGHVVNHHICNSIIHSDKRTTYTIVNDIISNENSIYKEQYFDFIKMFKNMQVLSSILREKRINRGAIEFDFPEAKIIVDKNGKPLDIKPYSRNNATSIIEEFMLVCNETIAEEFYWLELPFVYRTHEEPDPEKLLKLTEFVGHLGYSLKGHGSHPRSIQILLSNIEATPEETIISRVVLRSFKQARYTPKNIGHFGLAAKYYCHFTSPIRRYPDLQIHRIIKAHIEGRLNGAYTERLNEMLPEVCRRCSLTERTAETAEREVDNLKKTEFMADKIGQSFEGIISGLTSWGLFVELSNTVEGMISPLSLGNDTFIFKENLMLYEGVHSKKTYRLGDKVSVTLKRANIEERTLDFVFC